MKNFDYCRGIVHVIKKGDSLYAISKKYNVPLALIMRSNPYVDVYNLQVGDEICVPATNMGGIGNIGIGRPRRPERPQRPEMPEIPESPEMPESSEMPESPEMPESSEIPAGPEMPESSEMPARPGMPVRPGMQQMTQNSDMSMRNMTKPNNSMESMVEGNMPYTNTSDSEATENKCFTPKMNHFMYIVKEGESLRDMLEKFDIDLDNFIANNSLSSILLKPGITMHIPTKRMREEDMDEMNEKLNPPAMLGRIE